MAQNVQRSVLIQQPARRRVATFGIFALGVLAWIALRRVQAPDRSLLRCRGKDPYLHVYSQIHGLAQCESGVATHVYHVRLGKGGLGKMAEGDGKTPRGEYPLGAPRASTKFGTFVPIHYPTPREAAHGYTGGAVGLHGPHRAMRWAGRFVNALDSTDGCVGLATDREIEELSQWLTRHPSAHIVID